MCVAENKIDIHTLREKAEELPASASAVVPSSVPAPVTLYESDGKGFMIDISNQIKEKYPAVLVVDDDMMNIEVMRAMLFSKKIDSDYALKGTEALKLIQERLELVYRGEAVMYKVILLDYSMPEMDGP